MEKKVLFTLALLYMLFAFAACKKSCDRDNPELCSDIVTVYDTVYTQNIYLCKKIETRVRHEFTVYETDKTSPDFGQPVATLSYKAVKLRAAYGCALSVYPDDCLGAEGLIIKNLCKKSIKVVLMMGYYPFDLSVKPLETVWGGSEQKGYCNEQGRIIITSVEKY